MAIYCYADAKCYPPSHLKASWTIAILKADSTDPTRAVRFGKCLNLIFGLV